MRQYSIKHQATATVLVAIMFFISSGCTVNKVKRPEIGKVANPQQEHIVGVTTKTGSDIRFDAPGGTVSGDEIQAKVKNAVYTVKLQDVQRLWIQYRGISAPRTIGLSVGIAAGALATLAAVVALTKQSCPFVYSWDGKQYVFDAEPYGGAITRGLERDDYSELEHLREEHGQYRLLLTNEVDETQNTNMMELWVVDHPSGSHVVSDETGTLRAFTNIQPLIAARDGEGHDLLPWMISSDRRIWEPDTVAGADGSLTQDVILTFPKPAGAVPANLIANAATGLWGSYMIKRMVELHGRDTESWLASLDNDQSGIEAIHAWGERERTYRLPIEVEEADGWQVRGALPSGGPLLAEDRAISLDISRVRGNQIRIRMRPPAGFWALNYFGVAFGAGEEVAINHIAATSAITSQGKNVLADLAAIDNRYYSMPDNSDHAEIVFSAPPRKIGSDRTVFLHSRGWYQLHLRDQSAPDLTTFNRILTVPGAASQFAADRFAEWPQGPVHTR